MHDLFQLLSRLAGEWRGDGEGSFPTIEPFRYREFASFRVAPTYPMLRYEQRAWLLPDEEPSHWELGLWRCVDGAVEYSNAQDSGRVEVLSAVPEAIHAGGFTLHFKNKCIANDPRLIETERILHLDGDQLSYEKFMVTTTTERPERIRHLSAVLRRNSSEQVHQEEEE